MTAWTDKFIGLPYEPIGRSCEGVDCYGLVRLVYADELGIALPGLLGAYDDPCNRQAANALISAASDLPPWCFVGTGLANARPFDVLVFRTGRLDSHMGLYAGSGRMLHVYSGGASRLECLESPGQWQSRLTGIWRHLGRLECGI